MVDIALKILLYAPPVLLSIILHEVSHGYVANRMGDPTAKLAGRLTLNPIKHIDIMGTIILPAILLIVSKGQLAFGWAKPVPVNPMRTPDPKKTMGITAAAGPVTNLLLAMFCVLVLKMLPLHSLNPVDAGAYTPLAHMMFGGLIINVVLGVFNLIPVPPLDGGRVMTWILPDDLSEKYARIEPFGLIIIFALLIINPGNILGKAIYGVLRLFLIFL